MINSGVRDSLKRNVGMTWACRLLGSENKQLVPKYHEYRGVHGRGQLFRERYKSDTRSSYAFFIT